ncbi:UNVERIFIED_CONTAM: hypothetical protein K2H54_051668 [Gekko kuhli]
MVTARQEPRLVLVSVACENGHLILNAPEMKELSIPVKLPEENPVKNCRVFGLDIEGRDCGDDVACWLTSFLNSELYRLVHFETQMTPRKCSEIKTPFRTKDKIPYNDAGPLLVISEASMEDLCTRMETKVDMRNFRPSITVSGCSAYEELLILVSVWCHNNEGDESNRETSKYQKRLQGDGVTILDIEKPLVKSKLLTLKEQHLFGGWIKAFKDEAVKQPVGTEMLKRIQVAKKHKKYHPYVSDRRDIVAVCNEVVDSLVEFLNPGFEVDADLSLIMK